MSRLIALYPRAWRERYELEFLQVMAARPPNTSERIDILRGALDARLHPQVASTAAEARPGMRVGGALGVLAGVVWVATSLAFHGAPLNLDLGYKESGSAVLFAVAAALLSGLSVVAVARALPRGQTLVWAAGIMTLLGGLAMLFPWPILLVGYFGTLFGIVVFGMAGAVSGLGPIGTLVAIPTLLAYSFNTEDERALLLIPLGVAWILFGTVLSIRGAPPTLDWTRLRAALQPPRNAI